MKQIANVDNESTHVKPNSLGNCISENEWTEIQNSDCATKGRKGSLAQQRSHIPLSYNKYEPLSKLLTQVDCSKNKEDQHNLHVTKKYQIDTRKTQPNPQNQNTTQQRTGTEEGRQTFHIPRIINQQIIREDTRTAIHFRPALLKTARSDISRVDNSKVKTH